MGEGHVAGEQDDGTGARGRDAVGGGERAVDAVGAAVGQHPQRDRPRGQDRLDIAHGHRRGDDEGRLRGECGAELERDPRLAELVAESSRDGRRGAGVRVAPGARPRRVGRSRRLRRERLQERRRIAVHRQVAHVRGVLPRAVRVDEHLHGIEAGEPLAQRLGGGEVPDAQDGAGRRGLREGRDPEQGVVVGDRALAAAGARQRVGEDGPAGRGAEGRRRAARRRAARRPASRAAPSGRPRRCRAGRRRPAARAPGPPPRRRSCAEDGRPRDARRAARHRRAPRPGAGRRARAARAAAGSGGPGRAAGRGPSTPRGRRAPGSSGASRAWPRPRRPR